MKYVIYKRVSTKKQDLGLDAQNTAINNYLKDSDEVLEEFIEKETGTNKKVRYELLNALSLCNKTGATLLIAKLDRLARNVAFTSNLMESGVDFIALDLPNANKLTIHIYSAMAEHEAELISKRTKSALAVLKAKGVKLGNPQNLTNEARQKGRLAHSKKAKENPNNKKAKAYIKALVTMGLSYSEIARRLNENGFKTSRGKKFQVVQVKRLLA